MLLSTAAYLRFIAVVSLVFWNARQIGTHLWEEDFLDKPPDCPLLMDFVSLNVFAGAATARQLGLQCRRQNCHLDAPLVFPAFSLYVVPARQLIVACDLVSTDRLASPPAVRVVTSPPTTAPLAPLRITLSFVISRPPTLAGARLSSVSQFWVMSVETHYPNCKPIWLRNLSWISSRKEGFMKDKMQLVKHLCMKTYYGDSFSHLITNSLVWKPNVAKIYVPSCSLVSSSGIVLILYMDVKCWGEKLYLL